MKVNIGPYITWWGPYQTCDLLKYIGVPKKARDWLAERLTPSLFDFIDSLRTRKEKVHIDDYDTWSADHTLALIILPLLKKLKEQKHGAPPVDNEDVPENLRFVGEKSADGSLDDNYFKRYDYILDEIIFAFEHIIDDEWEYEFYSGVSDYKMTMVNPDEKNVEKQLFEMVEGPNHTFKIDHEGLNKIQDRIKNGLRLFGKYYQTLWT